MYLNQFKINKIFSKNVWSNLKPSEKANLEYKFLNKPKAPRLLE